MKNNPREDKKVKPDICEACGQKVDKDIWLKHTVKMLRKNGMPSLAKSLLIVSKRQDL